MLCTEGACVWEFPGGGCLCFLQVIEDLELMEGSEREKVGGKQNVNMVSHFRGKEALGSSPTALQTFEVSLSSSEIT